MIACQIRIESQFLSALCLLVGFLKNTSILVHYFCVNASQQKDGSVWKIDLIST